MVAAVGASAPDDDCFLSRWFTSSSALRLHLTLLLLLLALLVRFQRAR